MTLAWWLTCWGRCIWTLFCNASWSSSWKIALSWSYTIIFHCLTYCQFSGVVSSSGSIIWASIWDNTSCSIPPTARSGRITHMCVTWGLWIRTWYISTISVFTISSSTIPAVFWWWVFHCSTICLFSCCVSSKSSIAGTCTWVKANQSIKYASTYMICTTCLICHCRGIGTGSINTSCSTSYPPTFLRSGRTI